MSEHRSAIDGDYDGGLELSCSCSDRVIAYWTFSEPHTIEVVAAAWAAHLAGSEVGVLPDQQDAEETP